MTPESTSMRLFVPHRDRRRFECPHHSPSSPVLLVHTVTRSPAVGRGMYGCKVPNIHTYYILHSGSSTSQDTTPFRPPKLWPRIRQSKLPIVGSVAAHATSFLNRTVLHMMYVRTWRQTNVVGPPRNLDVPSAPRHEAAQGKIDVTLGTAMASVLLVFRPTK